jgi:hypothetical protein
MKENTLGDLSVVKHIFVRQFKTSISTSDMSLHRTIKAGR